MQSRALVASLMLLAWLGVFLAAQARQPSPGSPTGGVYVAFALPR